MNETFEKKITIIDQWETFNENYRLINFGAGPDVLQVLDGTKWKEESSQYRWGVLTRHIGKRRENNFITFLIENTPKGKVINFNAFTPNVLLEMFALSIKPYRVIISDIIFDDIVCNSDWASAITKSVHLKDKSEKIFEAYGVPVHISDSLPNNIVILGVNNIVGVRI